MANSNGKNRGKPATAELEDNGAKEVDIGNSLKDFSSQLNEYMESYTIGPAKALVEAPPAKASAEAAPGPGAFQGASRGRGSWGSARPRRCRPRRHPVADAAAGPPPGQEAAGQGLLF